MSKVAKAAIGLMVATLIAKTIGFARELTLASYYGTSSISDIFLVAMNIPAVIFTAIGTSLGTAFIPLYNEIDSDIGSEETLKFTNNVFNLVVFVCISMSILGVVFAPNIVNLFAVGFEGEILNQAIYFTRVLILGLIFIGMSYIMMAYLQVRDKFIVTGFMPIPYNILIIVSIILSYTTNLYILPWGTLIGLSLQFVFLYPFASKEGYKYNPYININDKYIKKMIYLIIPVIMGVAVNQINTIVDRTIASTLIEGSISALNYATKLNQFFMGIFIVSITSAVYPTLSKLSITENKEYFNKTIVRYINIVIILTIPISIGCILLSRPIVSILFQRGAFDERATYMTTVALTFYSIGMIGYGLRDILGKIFYSIRDTKTPMINGIVAVVLNIILNLFFIKYTNMQLAGLALATSISAIFTVIILFISLRKKIGYFGEDKISFVIVKSLVATSVMSVCIVYMYRFMEFMFMSLEIGKILNLLITFVVSIIIYIFSLKILEVEEMNFLLELIKSRLNR